MKGWLSIAGADGGEFLLIVALIVVCGAIAVVSIVSLFARLTVLVRYRRNTASTRPAV